MGILEFFGLGNNAPAPAAVEPEEVAAAVEPEEVAAAVEPEEVAAAVEPEEVAAAVEPEEVAAAVEPEEVEEDEAETVDPAPEAVEPSEVHSALHSALVKLDGRLSDPAALPYDEAHLTDHEALSVAIGELIERAPHLSATAVAGDVGQGDRGGNPAPFDLIATMRHAHGIM